MTTAPTKLYRFLIEGPVSPGVLSAVDEADESNVWLLHVALDGVDSGDKLEALEQLATERGCESFTHGSDFYVVARSEAEGSELARVIESRGLETFSEPEAARQDASSSAGLVDKTAGPLRSGVSPPVQIPPNPSRRQHLSLWGAAAILFLIFAAGATIWFKSRPTARTQTDPPPVSHPVVEDRPKEQGGADAPPVKEKEPEVHPGTPVEPVVPEQTAAGNQPKGTGEAHSEFRPLAPPTQSTPIEPPVQSAPEKVDQRPSIPAIENTQVAPPVPPPPPKIRFYSDSSELKLGQTTSLRWEVSGASDIRIEPNLGPVSESGSLTVRPMGKTVYTLHAVGRGGEANASVGITISGVAGPTTGQLIWTGNISGTQLVTIEHDHADVGSVEGTLPRLPCIIQPTNEKKVGVVAAPSPTNNYDRLVLRVMGKGATRVVIDWAVEY